MKHKLYDDKNIMNSLFSGIWFLDIRFRKYDTNK